MATIEWKISPRRGWGNACIDGQIRLVCDDASERMIAVSMSAQTITAFAAAASLEEEYAAQVSFGSRVLEVWGLKWIRDAVDAGVEVPCRLSLDATPDQVWDILRSLAPLNGTDEP